MSKPFTDHRTAALALINSGKPLRGKEGQFCGGIAFSDYDLTDKQLNWLQLLLQKNGLPPMEAAHG